MRLFRIDGPVGAIEIGSGVTGATACEVCGRYGAGKRLDPVVELVSEHRALWVTDRLRLLVPRPVVPDLGESAAGRKVEVNWRDGFGDGTPPPELDLLAPKALLAAAPQTVKRQDCVCRQVRSIDLEPLLVSEKPTREKDGIWSLEENPDITLVSEQVRDVLQRLAPDLETVEVFTPEEVTAQGLGLSGETWSDV